MRAADGIRPGANASTPREQIFILCLSCGPRSQVRKSVDLTPGDSRFDNLRHRFLSQAGAARLRTRQAGVSIFQAGHGFHSCFEGMFFHDHIGHRIRCGAQRLGRRPAGDDDVLPARPRQ